MGYCGVLYCTVVGRRWLVPAMKLALIPGLVEVRGRRRGAPGRWGRVVYSSQPLRAGVTSYQRRRLAMLRSSAHTP